MKKLNRSSKAILGLTASLAVSLSFAHAGNNSFTLSNSSTSGQSLGNGQTGTVTSTGSLTVSGTAVAIAGTSTSSANLITIDNSGKIISTGGRAIRDQSGGSDSLINNYSGGLIQASANDVIALNVAGSAATTASITDVENAGTIQSLDDGGSGMSTPTAAGNQALNFTKTTGSTTVDNLSTGVIWATAADTVRPGVNGVVHNDGFIYSNAFYSGAGTTYSGSSSDGIDAQTDSGITIVNGYTTSSANTAEYTGTVTMAPGGVNTAGVALTQSTIEGGRHGITGGNTAETGGTVQYGGYTGDSVYTMSITNNAGALIEGDDGSGINIDGFGIQNPNGTFSTNESVSVTNYGTITGSGQSRDGDGIDVDGDVIINNQGSIISKNASPEASDPANSIEFSEGVTVGGGSIVNGSITNSTAMIEGEVASGNTRAVGRGITLAGIDHDVNDNSIPIESIYENSSITNNGLIKGDSESGIAVLGTTGGGYTVTITNNATGKIVGNNTGVNEDAVIPASTTTQPSIPTGGELSGQSLNQGAIELDDTGNSYVINNYGTIEQDGASGVAVAMHGKSNVLNVYGGSIGGDVTGDTAIDSTMNIDPGTGGTFTYSHNISNFAVNINSDGNAGTVNFTGTIGNTGPTTVNAGKLDISGSMIHSATTVKSGGTLSGSGAAGGVTVNSGGTAAAGDSATVLAATQAASTSYQFSLTGMTVDGGSTLSFDLYHAAPGTGTINNPAGGTMFNLGSAGVFAAGANVTAGSILLNFNGSDVGGTPADPNVYDLVTFGSGATTLALDDFTIENLDVDGGGAYSLSYEALTNGQEALVLDVAPEPGTWALLGLGLAGLVVVGRFRKRSA
jgi:hypothetical protein